MKKPLTTGIEQIDQERTRQILSEGFTADHDGDHQKGELAAAAGTYALSASAWGHYLFGHPYPTTRKSPSTWPWADEDWKPTYENKIKMLAKAGALIAAEIDRLIAAPSEEK